MNEISGFQPTLLSPRERRDLVAVGSLQGATPAPTGLRQVEPKAPGLVGILSLLMPGLGQFVNGERKAALAFFAAFVIGWQLVPFAVGVPVLVAVIAWSAIDAWADAKAWNREHRFDLR